MHNLQMHLRYKLETKSIILKAMLLAHYSDLVYSSGFAKEYYIGGGCRTIICTDMKYKVKLLYYFLRIPHKII